MLPIILFLCFLSILLFAHSIIPWAFQKVSLASDKRQVRLSTNMEQYMSRVEAKKMSRLFIVSPFLMAIGLFFLFPKELQFAGFIIGIICGLFFPSFYISFLTRRIRNKFDIQLVDALMIMSSSFRGGLSLVQALEAVVDEMPDPMRSEIGTVLGENKMGVSLDEAFNHLYSRMPSPALQQMITSILLARETGGNLPLIFNRIVNNIRETRKVAENLSTLTIQGKIQGVVMTLLPIVFAFFIYTTNRRIFMNMIQSQLGRGLLTWAVISECIGAYMIWRISSFKDF